ncbi:hypothetical protein TNCT_481551 [Trichonephila clavata]|uniref:Uncharacterized protein n=1 Tax=Trichonephila clavata TaxID=2740835 RepID=A0A8X6I8G0_TRICU|nr:hypothetical protein TNCT_481551 [Trichonephila clavata]
MVQNECTPKLWIYKLEFLNPGFRATLLITGCDGEEDMQSPEQLRMETRIRFNFASEGRHPLRLAKEMRKCVNAFCFRWNFAQFNVFRFGSVLSYDLTYHTFVHNIFTISSVDFIYQIY